MADSIRVGHATNSSSTHSIVLLDDGQRALGWQAPDGADYGWDHFILRSVADKREYLYHDLRMQVERLLTPAHSINWYRAHDALSGLPDGPPVRERAAQVASAILEHRPTHADGYIDHQSTFSWPLDRDTGLPHIGFARWYRDRILSDRVAVLGGNDNEEGPWRPHRVGWELPHDEFSSPSYCYERDDHWLLWESTCGVKLRIPKVEGTRITRSTVPELVDVKITNQCGRGCRFCYQDSTPTGLHSSMLPHEMASVIRGLGVLEVAIGGGEPLEYPRFWELVDLLNRDGVVVNVTTRRLDLIPPWRLDKLGGVGFSAETAAAFEAGLAATRIADGNMHDNPWRKLVLHVVLGATPMAEVVRICELAKRLHLPVLLLGWKDDGRGASFQPYPHDDWPEVLRQVFTDGHGAWTGPRIGVDTPIVERWGTALRDRLGVDPRLMVGGEGAFSLYLDFVAMTVSRASYGPGERVWAFPPPDKRQDTRQLVAMVLDTFRGWAG